MERTSRLEPTCIVYRYYSHDCQPCVMEMTQGTAISFALVLSFQVGNSQIDHLCKLCNFVPVINRTNTRVPFILPIMTFSFSVILSTELSSLRSGEFLLFFQNCYVYPLCLLYLCSYTGINLRPPIQQSTLKYEKQFPSRHPTTLHYQMLQFLGGFAFFARRALIPEAESNLWCLTHDVVSQIHLSPPLPSLLLCLSW